MKIQLEEKIEIQMQLKIPIHKSRTRSAAHQSTLGFHFPFVEISCINHSSLIFSYFLASGPFNATTKPVRTSLTGRFSELIPANHKTIFLFIFVFVFVFVLTFCISHLCYILFSQSGETELVPPGHKTYNILLHVKQH